MKTCNSCGKAFMRNNDVEKHIKETGHKNYTRLVEESDTYVPNGYIEEDKG
jgi:uncharacterized C2H2 Zn-finger protein